MGARKISSDQRLALIIETQREIFASDDELHTSMQLIAERSQAIIDADGAMVNLVEGEWLHTVGVSGTAVGVFDVRRPLSGSIARFAIADGKPILIQDCPNDPRIDQTLRARVGDHSLICMPLLRGQQVIGTLNVMRNTPEDPLDDEDCETLELISVVLASTVARAAEIEARQRAEQELKRQAELNEFQALHDPLTGLPNRILFSERIDHAILQAQRQRKKLAVALIDLDRFKEINDSLGHSAGDQLLINVGERMGAGLRASDTVARLGGDEFGLLLPELAEADALMHALQRVRATLEEPIHVQSLPIGVEASIGIAIYPDHGEDAQTLMRRADIAMYEAKRDGLGYVFYDESAHDHDMSGLTLVAELRRAISERELVLYYQPKAALESGVVTSVEALLRWQHPERGLVQPDAFIPLAQETSLIGPLTLYVVEEALRQTRSWQEQGIELSIAVNLSTRNLLDRSFPNQVEALLSRWSVKAESLELEVTESSMLANPARAKAVLKQLSDLGIRLSIDDFGTGYSSLAYLRELPVDEIKIDRSFVIGMGADPGDAVIVRSTVDLGRTLGLEVVAEGVETLEHWERLRELGCNTAQGYFLSRPVPAQELCDWLRARPALPQVKSDVRISAPPRV